MIGQVLMTADAVGGVFRFAVDLVRTLGASGVHVTLALMGPRPSAAQLDAVERLSNATVVWRPFRLEWMDDPWPDVSRAADWLLELEAQCKPDVVHLNGFCHASLPWRAPVVVTAHSCVLSWWREVHGVDAPPAWKTYTNRVLAGLKAADLVVAPTSAMLSMLERHYGAQTATRVIPNGCDTSVGQTDPIKEPFVFSAARVWDPAKNVAALGAVASGLAWPIRVAGETRTPFGAQVACPDVQLLGMLPGEAVQSWMSRAAIYALPARYEPFGLSVLEAAGTGCALVLGDIATLREIWGDAAAYVDPDDSSALRQTLQSLIDDEPERRASGARAREVATALTAERMASAYLETYGEVGRRAHHAAS
jgi:glycogen synthase